MLNIFQNTKKKADKLFAQAQKFHDEGSDEKAIEYYKKVIHLNSECSFCHYNIGLIYKYRNDWENSFEFNHSAYELKPEDESTLWNLGIAATALRDWETARKMWRECGFEIGEGSGPIEADFGYTPIRLNPEDQAEVVWAIRIDPVRAKITSVPLPESGHCAGDIVLHDGAAVGYRMYEETEYPVFNELELFEKSALSTYKINIQISEQADADVLQKMLSENELLSEDWTTDYRVLCKACSEGRPHEAHDQEGEQEWTPEHEIAVAAHSLKEVEEIANKWANGISRNIINIECAFSRGQAH